MLSVIYMICKPANTSATNAQIIPLISIELTPKAFPPVVLILPTATGFYGSLTSIIFRPATAR